MSESDGAPRGPRLDRRHLISGLGSALGGGFASSAASAQAGADLKGGRYHNPPGSPESGGGFGDWSGFLWRRLVHPPSAPAIPEGHLLPPAAALAGWQALAGRDAILWLGHASFLVRLAGRTVLIDPFLSERASPFVRFGPKRFAPPGLAVEQLPRIDLILLSHNHYDHLDLPALRRLAALQQPPLITTLGVSRYLEGLPFRPTLEIGWRQSVAQAGLEIEAVPAIHFSKRTPFDRNRTLWCGYVLKGGGRSVYFTGDTAFGPVFADLAQHLAPPDLALVPIGAYAPRALMRAAHCLPEEGVAIGRTVRAKRLCGMHWGTIALTDEPPFEPPGRFAQAAVAAGYAPEDAFVLPIGGSRAF